MPPLLLLSPQKSPVQLLHASPDDATATWVLLLPHQMPQLLMLSPQMSALLLNCCCMPLHVPPLLLLLSPQMSPVLLLHASSDDATAG